MFNFLDLLDRSATGEPMAVSDWDFALAMAVRRLVKKYGLDWDRTHVINDDPARADAIFDAALELAIELGVYNYSTGRVVKFTPDELLMGLRKAPQALTLGEGKDARILYARKVGDARPPLAWAGTPGTPVPEHLFLPMAVSYAQEPLVDMMTCGTLTHVDGRVVETGSPLEIVATRRELQYLREAQRRAGRPGIGLLAAQSSVSALGDLSVAHPAYLRPCDSHLVPMLNELKIENGNIARAVNSLEYGMLNASLACVIVGGMGGDAPGSAVVQAASFILANLVCAGRLPPVAPHRHPSRGHDHARRAVGEQRGRPGFRPARAVRDRRRHLSQVRCGHCGAALRDRGQRHRTHDQRQPPGRVRRGRRQVSQRQRPRSALYGRGGARGHGAGARHPQANAMVSSLLEKYEFLFERGAAENPGLPFDQVYDVETIQPTPAWQATYEEVKQAVRRMGLTEI